MDSKGWIQISKVWKFGSPFELAFLLKYEKESSAWKTSVQNLIDALLEKQQRSTQNMSQEGKRNKD
jgi:hypothetical protein